MTKFKNFGLLIPATIFAFVMWIGTLNAQHRGGPPSDEKKAEIEAMKVGFLTQKLELTPDEAKTFWPVYNQYQDELGKLRDSHRKERKAAKEDIDTMSDKEVEKLVDGEIVFRQSELDILKKYNSQFKSVLPMKKVEKLYRAEEDFKRELLQRIREKQGRGEGGPSPSRDDRKN
jgi:hypothetical protein